MTDQNDAASAVRSPTDIEVAQFLADFRDRAPDQQESSPVYQELAAFPQWAGAQYRGDEAPVAQIPPDPRLPPLERREAIAAQAAANPQPPSPHDPQPAPAPNAITTGAMGQNTNPWADYNPPPEDGSAVFLNCNTDVRPPFPGEWQRRVGGWFRPATV